MEGDRTPKDLQGLLNFCLEATKSEDATGSSEFSCLPDEDKLFIQNALRAAMGSDPVKLMMQDLKILTTEEVESDQKEEALENLQMHCEDLDLANDFYKIGGYSVIEKLLTDKDHELRWRAADLVGTTVQNNPYCQDAALKSGFMQILLGRLDKDEKDIVRIKALFAVSSLTRAYQPSYEVLLAEDGLSVLMRTLQSKNDKLETKVAFLLAYLFETAPRFKALFCEVGIIEQLVALLHQEHKPHHEFIMRALATLVHDNATAVEECKRPEFNLKTLLSERNKLLAGKEEYKDEYGYCQAVLKVCFTGATAAADR